MISAPWPCMAVTIYYFSTFYTFPAWMTTCNGPATTWIIKWRYKQCLIANDINVSPKIEINRTPVAMDKARNFCCISQLRNSTSDECENDERYINCIRVERWLTFQFWRACKVHKNGVSRRNCTSVKDWLTLHYNKITTLCNCFTQYTRISY